MSLTPDVRSKTMNPSTPQEVHLSQRDTLRIVAYFFALNILAAAGTGLMRLPISFYLKDGLHLQAQDTAWANLLVDSPYFVGFIFGFLRDRWHPFRMQDRGYFLVIPIVMTAALTSLAMGTLTYPRLVVTMAIVTSGFILLGAAIGGLLSTVSKRYAMTGRLSVVFTVTTFSPGIINWIAGGWLVEHLGTQRTFLVGAALLLPISLLAFWKPKIIYSSQLSKVASIPENAGQAFHRLLHTRVVYLPAAILILFSFMPGWNTPLFYYLTNTLKLSAGDYGISNAFGVFGNVLLMLSYSQLCRRFNLRFSLFLGTTLVVFGGPLYFFVRTPFQVNAIQFLTGASLGIAYAAFYDLLARSCPKHLEGTAFMLASAGSWVSSDVADVFGGWLYQHGGFLPALLITSLTSAMIFPVLFFIPNRLTSTHDGQRVAEAEEEEKLESSSGMGESLELVP